MVVSIRELANTLFLVTFTTIQPKPMADLPFNIDMNVDINMIR